MDIAKKDRELQDREKDVKRLCDEVNRWKLSHSESAQEYNRTIANLEGYVQDLNDQKTQLADLESQLDIEKYGNSLKSAIIQDLNVKLAQEQASLKANESKMTQNLDLLTIQMQEQSRDYEAQLLDLQRNFDNIRNENLRLQATSDQNMLHLEEVMETLRTDQEKVIISKNEEILKISEKLSDATQKLVEFDENIEALKCTQSAEWEALFYCFQTLLEITRSLKKCLKTQNIDDVIPFLEETRKCYKGDGIPDQRKMESVSEQMSSIYSIFRDIAMAWMKHSVGADKDYDNKELAEVLEYVIQLCYVLMLLYY